MKKNPAINTSRGFTIVELLIVVVVIAILAAITIVSYNGISSRAKESSLKTDLSTAVKKLNIEKIDSGSFPATSPDYITDGLSYMGGGTAFCVSGEANSKIFRIDENGTVEEGECIATMQSFTPSQCSALATYTGANETALVSLTDSRGGTERTYRVAKLADDNCWMLDNLKLGSTTGTITLTPVDSDVASNFTLPQLITTGTASSDSPQAVGPVPGDTGSSATNYGYLYNWPGATAGESRTSHPASAGNAPHSICPANWRLPTGNTTGEFAWLNAKMNNPNAASPSNTSGTGYYQNWQYSGPFKGVLSGYWATSFSSQGVSGYLWSSSAYSSHADYAFLALFQANYISPAYNTARVNAMSVRCLLN